jgi:hypothetical protein
MKLILTENQIYKLLEKINSNSVTCDECGWSWELSEGGDDPYVCHQCGHDNSEYEFLGKRVMVYYNLHKHTFSVTYKSKVILHADYVKLGDVEFRVRKGGKEKVRVEKSKNVHAFVIGNLLDYCQYPCDNIPSEPNDNIVTYNPYKYDSFVYKNTEEPVYNAKEVEMINLKNKLFVINEIKSSILREAEEEPTKYTYTTIGLYDKWGIKRYYFNKVLPVVDDSPIPNKIKIFGSDGDFILNKEDVKIDYLNKKIHVDKKYFDLVYPNFKFKSTEKLSEKIGITSSNVREALKQAFPNEWKNETPEFTAGLRGVYTIGEKLGTDEDWSIMNYFDTKDEIHSLIYLKYFDYLKENPDKEINDIVSWMAELFTTDIDFTKLLVDRQWSSIESGLKLERYSIDNFIDKIGGSNVKYYPHGSKMDRWFSVDVTVNNTNFQIKPLTLFKKENDEYIVGTYGMTDYKSKKKVDKIAFVNFSKCIIIDNKDYKVLSKTKVSFKQKPQIIN